MGEFASHINKFMRQTVGALTLVDNQLTELNNILFALLKELAMSEEVVCANCDENITRPQIEGLQKIEECPACGGNLDVDKKSAVEDWDNSSA